MSFTRLSFFPLNLVLYPGESLNLHIFEPRYKQLIAHCIKSGMPFGVVPYIEGKIKDHCTTAEIVSVEKVYEDGRMDIKTIGREVFEIENFENPYLDNLYAGGAVNKLLYFETEAYENTVTTCLMLLNELKLYVGYDLTAILNYDEPLSWQLGHKVGLSVESEYQLLLETTEEARLQLIIAHLNRVIPILKDVNRTKERIKMNGHFKTLDPISF